MSVVVSLALGLGLSSLIGAAAYLRGSLTVSGVVGAIVTGTAIFGLGGFVPGLLLVAFFISSSALSHLQARAKKRFSDTFQKGSRRDLGQALANGGWASLLATAYGVVLISGGSPGILGVLMAGIAGALATVTADTWATEIGVLSRSLPRLITTGRRVPAGTSGGVTPLGTITALAGAIFIGAMAVAGSLVEGWLAARSSLAPGAPLTPSGFAAFIVIAGVAGLVGCLFDSLLGATLQAIYFCEYDARQTEQRIHACGRATRRVRGWAWLDNDLVNFFASVVGGLIAMGLQALL